MPVARSDESLLEVMASMRAMRRLRPDPVPDELIRELVEAAQWAPNAGSQQGQVFVVVTDRAQIARLAEVWRKVVDIYGGWIAKADPRFGRDPVTVRTWEAVRYQRDHFGETPVVIVACYDQRAFNRRLRRRFGDTVSTLRRVGWRGATPLIRSLSAAEQRSEAASIYPAIQNLLLVARARGLGANLTTWHLLAERDVKAILGIPKGVRTYAIIPIGWPLGRFGPVSRRPVNSVLRRNHW